METNKTYSYQAKTMKEVEAVLNVFCTEKNVFSTQIFPILDNGTSIGYDILVWYKETSSYLPQEMEGLSNYDIAKSKKAESKANLPASEKQIKYLLGLGYKGDTNLTMLQAKRLIEDFVK